jgi:hypothetical protein
MDLLQIRGAPDQPVNVVKKVQPDLMELPDLPEWQVQPEQSVKRVQLVVDSILKRSSIK